MNVIERFCAAFGPDVDLEATAANKLRLFLIFGTMLYLAERAAYLVGNAYVGIRVSPFVLLIGLGSIALAGMIRGRHLWPWVAIILSANVIEIRHAWHGYANHGYLYTIGLLVVLCLDGRRIWEKHLTMNVLRWLMVTVIVGSAIQKLVHGAWTGGEYLTMAAATGSDRYIGLFRLLGLQDELFRVQAWQLAVDSGPYTSKVPQIIVLSNIVWLAELLLPFMLFFRRWRNPAALLLMVFVLSIQVVAVEPFFALLAANYLVLFFPRGLAARPRLVYWVGPPLAVAAGGVLLARHLS